jgi:hypothetical protein
LCFPELGPATAAAFLEVEQFRQPGLVERPVQIANRRVLAADSSGGQSIKKPEARVLVEPHQVAQIRPTKGLAHCREPA